MLLPLSLLVPLLGGPAVNPSVHTAPSGGETVKVACIGDSITFGSKVAARERNHYPAQLGHLLGSDYEVRNFGVGGATMLSAADNPYTATQAWKDVLEWAPDVAIVILGTNDTCRNESRSNWEHSADLDADARAMVAALRKSRPAVRVLLCSPPPMFPTGSGLSEERRKDLSERAPRLTVIGDRYRQVAEGKKAVEFHDLSRVLTADQTVDGAHTSPFGARALATRLAQAVLAKRGPSSDPSEAFAARNIDVQVSEYFGFVRSDFRLPETGAECILVRPHVTLRGRPWLWRMRFFGHEPDLELDLLDSGVHLAYVDVAGLYGSPQALARMEEFYALLRDSDGLRLSGKPILMGMSRGGLPALQWVTSNPKKTAGLYGDNAVFDLSSWPGGKSAGRHDAEWAEALGAWGWDDRQGMTRGDEMIPRSARPAKEGLPLFLAVGMADEIVPPGENSMRLASAWVRRGGRVVMWRKPGAGHHPHGLHPPDALARGLLGAWGHPHNPAAQPTPSAEYRGYPAGWGGGTWWEEFEALQALGRDHATSKVVFLGDSITQSLTGSKQRVAVKGGERPFDRDFGDLGAVNLGMSGDRTEHLLYRIRHGALASMDPKVIVLQIGANNISSAQHTAVETAAGIRAVVDLLEQREPQARIVVCGPFPVGQDPEDPRRIAVDKVHKRISPLGKRDRVIYVDLRRAFLGRDRKPNQNMASDALHISPAGQDAWLSVVYFSVLDSLGR